MSGRYVSGRETLPPPYSILLSEWKEGHARGKRALGFGVLATGKSRCGPAPGGPVYAVVGDSPWKSDSH